MPGLTNPRRCVMTAGLLLMMLAGGAACTPGFEGEYSDPAKQEIIDDKWNETDARKTAETMIKAMLEQPWLKEFKGTNKRPPVVIIADIENRTDEHLDTKALTEFIEEELINSRQVEFVAKNERQTLPEELKYQQSGNVDPSTAKKEGKQIGADYMLTGAVSSRVAKQDELKKVTYQTALTLINIQTFKKEWAKKYHISKKFRRSGAGW